MFQDLKSAAPNRWFTPGGFGVLGLLALSLLAPATHAGAANPQLIAYQGRLRTSGNVPVTGATAVQFSLYNHPTNGGSGDAAGSGGPLVWKEAYDGSSGPCAKITPDAEGYFTAQLGSCTAFPGYLDFTAPLYLGIKVESDAEATPRVPLSSSPYAFNAQTVGGILATSTAAAGQLLSLDSGLNFSINTGSFSGARITLASTTGVSSILGTLGVGTATPATVLDVYGPLRFGAYAQGSLPAAGVTGQLARVTNGARGLWMDQGTQWFSLSGETYNVKEFGAKGDGVTNDSAAIQATIAAVPATGGTVLFPPGTYSLGSTGISIPTTKTNLKLVGNATLAYSGPSQAVLIGSTSTDISRITLEDLKIDTTAASSTATGIVGYRTFYLALNRLYVYTNAFGNQTGILLDGTGYFSAYTNWVDTQVTGLFKIGLHLKGPHNNGMFSGGATYYTDSPPHAGTIGVWMQFGGQNVFSALDVENYEVGYKDDSGENQLMAARTEGNTTGVKIATSAPGTRVIGGSHGDGVVDQSGTALVQGSATGLGMENHLTGYSFLDTSLAITGNYGVSWNANGGSSGLFWRTSSTSPIDSGLYNNGALNLFSGTATDSRDIVVNAVNSGGLIRLQNQGTTTLAVAGTSVGIGTTTPVQKLQIVGGSIQLDNNAGLLFFDSGGSARTILTYSSANNLQLFNTAATGVLQIGNGNNVAGNGIQLFTGSPATAKVVINTNGDVGIGTTSPNARLHVFGGNVTADAGGSVQYRFENNGAFGGTILYSGTNDNIDIYSKGNGSSPRLSVQAAGNVGIGTTTPSQLFEVYGGNILIDGGGATNPQVRFGDHGAFGGTISYNTASGSIEVLSQGDGVNPRMVIQSGGNIGIGTRTPAFVLQVHRSGDGDVAGFTDADGTCTINPTNTALSCSSDARLKRDAATVDGALGKVMKLRGISFHWLNQSDDTNRFGFIAQEVEKVIPELVTTDQSGYKSLNYTSFAPFLVEAIKAQQEQLQGLALKVQGSGQVVNQDNLTVAGTVSTGTLYVKEHAIFSGDSVGQAKILAGSTAVRIPFQKTYAYQPVVTVSPTGQSGLSESFRYAVTDKSADGFSIEISSPAASDLTFDWHAFGGDGARLFVSDGSTGDATFAPAPVPADVPPPQGDAASPAASPSSTPESGAGTPTAEPPAEEPGTPEPPPAPESAPLPDAASVPAGEPAAP